MAISNLINQFAVTSVPVAVKSDIRLNIFKRREIITHRSNTLQDYINLAYTVNKELSTNENIFISDRSTELAANRIPEDLQPIIFHGKAITLITNKFKATDIFVKNVIQDNVPLFFKHVLKKFDVDNTEETVNNISIRDNNFKLIEVGNIIFDKNLGIVYSNLENNVDDLKIYYVAYSIRNTTNGNINSYTEILDNELIYRIATVEDLSDDGQLFSTDKIYTVDELSSSVFEINFLVPRLYAIQEELDSRIRLIHPPESNDKNPWFVSISNGSFFTTLFTSINTYSIFKYNIPEFETQLFNPEFPFKFRQSDICFQIDNKLFGVLKKNIVLDEEKFIDVILRNADETPRFAFTTNPNKLNTLFENTILFQDGIVSVDRRNGIVNLSVNIKDTDIIESSYYFNESELELIDIDFNPINNISILEKRIIFYVVPNTNDTRSKTVFYLIVNRKGIIESTNQSDNSSLLSDISTQTFYYDKPSVDSTHLNFLDKYTVQAISTYQFTNISNPKYLSLGDITVVQKDHPSNTVLFDIRKPGGGIKTREGLIKKLLTINPELMWTTQVGAWNGVPYPGNAAMMIEIPTTIQKEFGGLFTAKEIREITERHMACGVYTIIRGYASDINPIVEVYG